MLHTHNHHRVCRIAAEQQQAALEKPFDLFKAIFENEDDPSSEEESSGTEEPPDGKEPQPAAVPSSVAATLFDYQGQSHQRNISQTEVPTAAQDLQAELSSVLSQQGSATDAPQHRRSVTPAGSPHQAAAPVQSPMGLHPIEHGSRPSSAKRRKLKGEVKEKSHKKKSKKEKDKKRSGSDAASDGVVTTLQEVCMSVSLPAAAKYMMTL